MTQERLDELKEGARKALQQAVDFSFACQKDDGHWTAPVSADATSTSQYVMFKYAIPGLHLDNAGEEAAGLRRWLLGGQNLVEGSWSLAPGLPGHLSTTVEAYLALRLLGTPASHTALQKARDFVLSQGGVARVRFFTRFFLATFGLFPWSAIPQLPAELILMPKWAPINIYVLSSWSRCTLIPVLVARHHEPVYPLPNGRCDPNNDFLDELWVDPANKDVPYAPPLWDLCFGRDRDLVELAFTLGDKILAQLGGLQKGPLRRLALRRCIDWLIDHQEKSGDWAGYFPPMHGGIWALLLEGFSLNHDAVKRGLEALERLAVTDESGKWIQPTVSPCWDTAFMVRALCDAGLGPGGDEAGKGDRDARIAAAVDWVRALQNVGPGGDWRIYSRNQQAGGWPFEYYNTLYPDVDDTAVVVLMLVAYDPAAIESEAVERAVEWILGMQSRDGGWGAFDVNNDARWLHKIPFSDMDSLVDPSTSDVTGRMLECFGTLLNHRKGGHRIRPGLARRLRESSHKALHFIIKEQTPSGAWWGRWGNNYNYGTVNVLRGLAAFCSDKRVARAALRAVLWLESCQNQDGGWGETLLSYVNPKLAGQGPSTSAHTAWALEALLRFRPASAQAVLRGVRWLVENQNRRGEQHLHWSSWPSTLYGGTGFPNALYLGYPMYHHYFAITALAKFLDSSRAISPRQNVIEANIPEPIVTALSQQNILLMVPGSRDVIEMFLSIASRLGAKGRRVRIATHPAHQALVESHGFEFYSVGGDRDAFAQVLWQKPNLLLSLARGNLGRLRRSLCSMFERFWQAAYDDKTSDRDTLRPANGGMWGQNPEDSRPFLADLVVATPTATVHVHAAESLQSPLVLVSTQPTLSTGEFPSGVFTMAKPQFFPNRWWNYATFFLPDVLDWLAFGSFVNSIRVTTCRMKPVCWVWATVDFIHDKGPHVCLWSSHLVPRPADWHAGLVVAGSAVLGPPEGPPEGFTPPTDLSMFLETDADKPTVAVSFGPMHITDPQAMISAMSSAADKTGAKVVICRSWARKLETEPSPPRHVYVADAVPHNWLLPRVHGFIHHGDPSHTAVGVRAGVPMLAIPFSVENWFWAAKIHELGLGPAPLETMMAGGSGGSFQSAQSRKKLAQGFQDVLSGRYPARCAEMAKQVQADADGAEVAAEVIKGELEAGKVTAGHCAVVPALPAQWQHVESGLGLSGVAAASLVESDILGWDDLIPMARLDWATKREVQTPKSRLHIFCAASDFLALVFSMLLGFCERILHLFGRARGADVTRLKVRDDLDPVRLARMRRSVFDLHFLRQRTRDEKRGRTLDEQFAQRWRAARATEFQSRFTR